MADVVDKIVNFKVTYAEAVEGIKQITSALATNKQTLKELDKQYSEEKITLDAYQNKQIELKATNKALTTQMRSYEKAIQDNIKAETAAEDSLTAMRAKVSELTAKYNAMSKAEREAAKGTEMATKIKALRGEVSEAEQALGEFRSQVGNYENAIKSALPINNQLLDRLLSLGSSTNTASAGTATLTTRIWAMVKASLAWVATPFGATIAAAAVAVSLFSSRIGELNDRIESSEDLMNSYNKAAIKSEAVQTAYTQALDTQAATWVALKANMSNAWSIIKAVTADTLNLVAIIAGDTESITKKILSDNSKLEQQLADIVTREQALLVKRREFTVSEAEMQKQIAELREQAKDQEKYTNEERLGFINEAKKLNEELGESRKELAQEEYDVYSARIALTESSTEELNKQAELKAKVINVDKQVADSSRSLNRTVTEATNAIKAENKALQDEAEAKAKAVAESAALTKQIEEEALARMESLTFELYEKSAEAEKEIRTAQTAAEVEEIEKRLAAEDNLSERAREALNNQIILLQEGLSRDLLAIDEKYNKESLEKAVAAKQEQYEREQMELELAILQTKEMLAEDPENGELSLMLSLYEEQQATQQLSQYQSMLEQLRSLTKSERDLMYEDEVAYQDAILELELAAAKESAAIQADALAKAKKSASTETDTWQAKAAAIGSISGSISTMISTVAGENEKAANAAKGLALLEIAANTAVGISEAVKAGAGLVFPANLTAIAMGVASVMSGITAAYSALSSSSSSTTTDTDTTEMSYDTDAYISSGDTLSGYSALLSGAATDESATSTGSVSTSSLLSSLSATGGDIEKLSSSDVPTSESYTAAEVASALSEAIAELPNPIVTVKDYSTAANRVAVQDNISILK